MPRARAGAGTQSGKRWRVTQVVRADDDEPWDLEADDGRSAMETARMAYTFAVESGGYIRTIHDHLCSCGTSVVDDQFVCVAIKLGIDA